MVAPIFRSCLAEDRQAFALTLSAVARRQRLALKAEVEAAVGAAAAVGCSASEIDLAGTPASMRQMTCACTSFFLHGKTPRQKPLCCHAGETTGAAEEQGQTELRRILTLLLSPKTPKIVRHPCKKGPSRDPHFENYPFSWPRWRRSSALSSLAKALDAWMLLRFLSAPCPRVPVLFPPGESINNSYIFEEEIYSGGAGSRSANGGKTVANNGSIRFAGCKGRVLAGHSGR